MYNRQVLYKGGKYALGIEKILKKEGIEIIKPLDTLSINSLAKNIASVLSKGFPNLNLNSNDLFMKLSRLNMYFAKLPNRHFSQILL